MLSSGAQVEDFATFKGYADGLYGGEYSVVRLNGGCVLGVYGGCIVGVV